MFYKCDWGNLYYEIFGGGRPLILLHEIGRSSRDLFPIAQYLSKFRKTILVDLCGHGQSGAPTQLTTVSTMAGDIISMIDDMYVGEADFVCHGLGGLVALEVQRRAPQFCGEIYLMDTFSNIKRAEIFSQQFRPVKDKAKDVAFYNTFKRWRTSFFDDFMITAKQYDAFSVLNSLEKRIIFVYGDRGFTERLPDYEELGLPRHNNIQILWVSGAGRWLPLVASRMMGMMAKRFIVDGEDDVADFEEKVEYRDLPPPSLGELLMPR